MAIDDYPFTEKPKLRRRRKLSFGDKNISPCRMFPNDLFTISGIDAELEDIATK